MANLPIVKLNPHGVPLRRFHARGDRVRTSIDVAPAYLACLTGTVRAVDTHSVHVELDRPLARPSRYYRYGTIRVRGHALVSLEEE